MLRYNVTIVCDFCKAEAQAIVEESRFTDVERPEGWRQHSKTTMTAREYSVHCCPNPVCQEKFGESKIPYHRRKK